jgi:nitrate/nitrite transporter NarK
VPVSQKEVSHTFCFYPEDSRSRGIAVGIATGYGLGNLGVGCLDVWMCVCVSWHNSVTPEAISMKLGTHIATCMCKNLMHVLYIFRRKDGVGGREFG